MTRWLAQLRSAFLSISHRRRAERDLEDEIRYHLDLEIEAQRHAGLSPDEARHAALRAMGAIEKSKDECRDLRWGRLVGEFLSDLRYAGRALRRRPGFAALAIAIVALGIGANTAVFSVVNGVLLKSLPYPDADRIVVLRTTSVKTGEINPLVTLANFWDWRAQSTSFEAMATYRGGETPVTPGDTAEYARHATVDVQWFGVFRVVPAIGRAFGPADLVPSNSQPVAIISDAYWQSRYGGDPGVLQRTIRVGNTLRHIVGVMPQGFQFPNRTDVWTPQTSRTASRTSHNLLAVARLKPGVPLASANAELSAIAARLAQQYPDSNEGRGVSVARLQDQLVRDVRLMLYLMWGAVGLVLVIACANTATLLLTKATARSREIAVRTALGASRRRIMRQLVTESLLLAIVAAAAGIALAYWGVQALVALTPADVVRLTDTRIDGGVLAFTLAVSLLASILFGLVPALHASKMDLAEAIKNGARATSGSRSIRTRGVLVVGQIALAVILLTGAGLLVRSLIALQNVTLGFEPANVLVMKATGVRSLRWMPTRNTRFRIAVAHCARSRLNSTRQALYERLGRHWSTQQVALHRVTTELLQQGQLCVGLDTFGHHPDAEAVRQRDGGLDDGGVVLVETETVGEGAVDLEHVDGEPFEIRERREPRTEIVERETDARVVQVAQGAAGLWSIVDQRSFGELEIDARRRQAVGGEFVEDELREAGVAELTS